MRVGFTGSSKGMSEAQERRLHEMLKQIHQASPIEDAHHGDCVGADAQFHEICLEFGIPVSIHPPVNPAKRANCKGAAFLAPPQPYLARNQGIVTACHQLLATPSGSVEKKRSGTWATVRYARRYGIPVTILWPDGSIQTESNTVRRNVED